MAVLGPRILLGPIPEKSPIGLLLPPDTRHVLKFRKDPFRNVDEIGSKSPRCILEGHAIYTAVAKMPTIMSLRQTRMLKKVYSILTVTM